MKTAIYQFWSGDVPYYANVSSNHMKKYAEFIGADYLVDINKDSVTKKLSEYYNCFKPIFDSRFEKYDKILFCDMDIFPVENVQQNIFECDIDKFGIASEERKIKIRQTRRTGPITSQNDEIWDSIINKQFKINAPRNNKNELEIYNSGVVVYTREGIEFAKKNWQPIKEYQSAVRRLPKFYQLDQNYLGAMLGYSTFTILDRKWNSPLYWEGDNENRHVYDGRTTNTQLVHIQLRGRDTLNNDSIYDIVNEPVKKWRHL